MRDTVLAVILGVVFLAALFVVAYRSPGGRDIQSPPPSGSRSVQPLRPGFAVVQRTGVWTLECLRPHKIPGWAKHMAETAAHARGLAMPPPRAPICHAITEVKADKGSQWMQMIFSLTPKGGFLTAVMRIDPDLAVPGEYLDLRLSRGHERVRVLLCGSQECIAVPVIRPQDVANMKSSLADQIAASNEAVLSLSGNRGTQPIAFNIPLRGLRPAIVELRRQTETHAR